MSRGARIAIAVLSVLCAAMIAGAVWLYVDGKRASERWLAEEMRLQEKIEIARQQRAEREARMKQLEVEAEAKAEEADEQRARADAAERKLTRRRDIPEAARPFTDERDAVIAEKNETIDLERASRLAMSDALDECQEALGLCKQETGFQEQVADGWRAENKRTRRRNRLRLAFTAIGAGAVGGVTGFAVGATR